MHAGKTRFVVVSGGVISGVGKGVASASIGKILQEHGYGVTLIKVDPYINFDAGTLRPTEHGEVWVTADGGEIDQDLGTYERFIGRDIPKQNNITTGQIYKSVIDRERRGEYLGQTVQFTPHIIDEIIDRITSAAQGHEFAIVEIGGTVGDYENAPFLYALKALEQKLGAGSMAYVFVTYMPIPRLVGEMKTRPARQSVHMLAEHGITPDFILCRSEQPLDTVRKKKIQEFLYLPIERIISAPDIESVYQVPLEFERQQLGANLLAHFNLESRQKPDWQLWQERVNVIVNPPQDTRVAIVGKYLDTGDFSLTDSYLSICHALIHAGVEARTGVEISWIDAKEFERNAESITMLSHYDGVIVPGGFGTEGVDGKIAAISWAREHAIPFLGLCYGLQLAAIEYARSVCKLADAHTTEVNAQTPHPIIDILPLQKQLLEEGRYGATMRLGNYHATLKQGSRVHDLYCDSGRIKHVDDVHGIFERHRHRYEVNPAYVPVLEKAGFIFSGTHKRIDGTQLMEFAEVPTHPFFIATQAHPEFTSRFGDPNPLFVGFVQAAVHRHLTITPPGHRVPRTTHVTR